MSEKSISCKIYHNPRCSKSRQTLALLEEKGTQIEIIEYLKSPLSLETLQTLEEKLGQSISSFVRTKEDIYKENGLGELSDNQLKEAVIAHPILLERPIVETKTQAAIGRPPENVLSIL